MSKTKIVTKDQIKHIRECLSEAEIQCMKEKNMEPMSKAMIDACSYLKEHVEVSGLYQYSQRAMYGKDIERVEERMMASSIYNDIYNDQGLHVLVGDITGE